MKLRVLDLFSGIGGFSLGLERTGGFETVAFCEFAEFPRKVLAKHWPDVPIFNDVRTLKGSDIDGPIDVVCGGYPCQPFSTAGQRRGEEDDRHLWPEFNRIVAELRPAWVIGENVTGHISMGLDNVLSDLEGQGYACRTFVIPSCAVNAPHRRERVWTVAHSEIKRSNERGVTKSIREEIQGKIRASGRHVAHSDDARLQRGQEAGNTKCIGARRNEQSKRCGDTPRSARRTESAMGGMADGISAGMDGHCRWPDEPDIGRVASGVKDRAHRLKALGNAVVPQIPEMIGRAILAAEEGNRG